MPRCPLTQRFHEIFLSSTKLLQQQSEKAAALKLRHHQRCDLYVLLFPENLGISHCKLTGFSFVCRQNPGYTHDFVKNSLNDENLVTLTTLL